MHRSARTSLARLACAALALALAPALARADEAAPTYDRSPFGLLATAGSFSGFGGGVTLGNRELGLRATAGWVPILLVLEDRSGNGGSETKVYSSLLLAPDVYVRLFGPPRMDFGLQAGYRYSSVLGSGVAAGGYGQFHFGPHLDGLVNVGFSSYFDGEKKLKEKEDLPEDTQFGFPGPSFQFAAGVGLVYVF